MTPHEAANVNSATISRPGMFGTVDPVEWASAVRDLLNLNDDEFAEAMRFDRSIWGA